MYIVYHRGCSSLLNNLDEVRSCDDSLALHAPSSSSGVRTSGLDRVSKAKVIWSHGRRNDVQANRYRIRKQNQEDKCYCTTSWVTGCNEEVLEMLRMPVRVIARAIEHVTNRVTNQTVDEATLGTSNRKKQNKKRHSITARPTIPQLITSLAAAWRLHRKGEHKTWAYPQKSDNSPSRAVMNVIDPSLQRHPSLLPQLLHSDLECICRSFVIPHSNLIGPVRENSLVELLR